MGYGDAAFSRDWLTLQLHLGSTSYPARPVNGYSEAYFRLLRTLGIVASQSHTLGVSREDFNTNCFCLATDTEKVSTVMSSGQNVQGIDMRVEGRYLSDGEGETIQESTDVSFIFTIRSSSSCARAV